MQQSKQFFPLLLLFFVSVACLVVRPQNLNAQDAQAQVLDKRAQVHSKQVHGGITPGQIPYLLAHSSGDVHLDSRGIVDRIMPSDAPSVLEDMTCDSNSDVIVLGKLGKGVSSPTVNQGYIYTDWDFTVEQSFKDNP